MGSTTRKPMQNLQTRKPEQRMQNLQMKMLKPPTGIFFFSIGLTAGAALHWLSMRTTSSSGVSLSLFPGGVKAFDTAPLLDACGENLQNKKNHATHILSTTVCLAPLHSAPCCSQKPHENPKAEETKHKNTHAKCALHMLSVPPSCFESGPAPCRETTGCSRKFACMSLSQARVSQKIKRNMQESLAKHCNENSAASRHLFCYLSASGPKNQWSIWPQKETDVKVQFKGFELCLAATDRSLEIPHGHA